MTVIHNTTTVANLVHDAFDGLERVHTILGPHCVGARADVYEKIGKIILRGPPDISRRQDVSTTFVWDSMTHSPLQNELEAACSRIANAIFAVEICTANMELLDSLYELHQEMVFLCDYGPIDQPEPLIGGVSLWVVIFGIAASALAVSILFPEGLVR
jgi:hypothetical protein